MMTAKVFANYYYVHDMIFISGADPGGRGGGGGGALGAEAPLLHINFRLYLINMLSIIMKFCLSIII